MSVSVMRKSGGAGGAGGGDENGVRRGGDV